MTKKKFKKKLGLFYRALSRVDDVVDQPEFFIELGRVNHSSIFF